MNKKVSFPNHRFNIPYVMHYINTVLFIFSYNNISPPLRNVQGQEALEE